MADEFNLEKTMATLPKTMSHMDMLRLLGSVLVAYSPGVLATQDLLNDLADSLNDYYKSQGGGECQCENCVARRKAEAH